jgi:hypothetical protein
MTCAALPSPYVWPQRREAVASQYRDRMHLALLNGLALESRIDTVKAFQKALPGHQRE